MTPLLAGAPQAIVREFSQQRARRGRYFSSAAANYIEDVFQTYLYTGNGSTQTITNGIDLAGEGGLVWIKNRNSTSFGNVNHALHDSARGVTNSLASNLTSQQFNQTTGGVTSFGSTGFSLGTYPGYNDNGYTYASWTFRKQAKFFDVVTYTGDGNASKTVSHNLGSAPGCIIVKRTDSASNWFVGHRDYFNSIHYLNSNSASVGAGWDSWISTSTTFRTASISGSPDMNVNGGTYVAYLFAHDAGGFGDSGNDSVVKCGSYTGNYSTDGPTVNLGWEPQWLLIKRTDSAEDWLLFDSMRGCSWTSAQELKPHTSDSEGTGSSYTIKPLPNGFKVDGQRNNVNASGGIYIYIAIRRGPMRTPTGSTNVYEAIYNPSSIANKINGTVGPIDLTIQGQPTGDFPSYWMTTFDRLRGSQYLLTASTGTEAGGSVTFDTNVGVRNGMWFSTGGIVYNFGRAPGFFDVVAYGPHNGTSLTVYHNLGVIPELVIYKSRSSGGQWVIQNGSTNYGFFNANAFSAGSVFTTLTSTSFSFTVDAHTYIAYLFATCPGVSKVGSYTGTGTTLSVDCGFTAGARFVLIKRTDSTGDWYVWDTARGIVSGNDPYLLLNSTAAEVTNTDFIDPLNSGFQISSTAPAAINANGGTFIFLAIA